MVSSSVAGLDLFIMNSLYAYIVFKDCRLPSFVSLFDVSTRFIYYIIIYQQVLLLSLMLNLLRDRSPLVLTYSIAMEMRAGCWTVDFWDRLQFRAVADVRMQELFVKVSYISSSMLEVE